MIRQKSGWAYAALAGLLVCPQILAAQAFTGADVLSWNEREQDSFFHTSVSMLGIVITRTGRHHEIAACVNEWYWDEEGVRQESNDNIREIIRGVPDYHPQAVILAVIEKACGQLKLD